MTTQPATCELCGRRLDTRPHGRPRAISTMILRPGQQIPRSYLACPDCHRRHIRPRPHHTQPSLPI